MSAAHKERLRPGELDGLVLSYLCKHRKEGPLTATAVGKRIGHSPGAVANCLKRLAKAKKVRLARKAPCAYLKEAKAR
jgi:hypothetical protein